MTRSLASHYESRSSSCGFALTDAVRLDLLAEMLGRTAGQMEFRVSSQEHLVVAGEAEYRRAVLALAAERQSEFAQTAQALRAKGLLTADEAGARPRLLLMVADGRSRDDFTLEHVAVPEVEWVDQGAPESAGFGLLGP